MTLTAGKLILAKDYIDPDVRTYVAAVEAADELDTPGIGALEPAVIAAYDNFIVGCKADGIWNAIKASCILAGARTLNGALVPLVGTAPTNFNFVAADYNRKTGLVGDGSTKYLDSNRSSNADPQNSFHLCVQVTAADSSGSFYAFIGQGVNAAGSSHLIQDYVRNRSQNFVAVPGSSNVGIVATSRPSATSFEFIHGGVVGSSSIASQPPSADNHYVFARNAGGGINSPTNARIAFYSIGESLDLALLDARVSTLISDLGAAIP